MTTPAPGSDISVSELRDRLNSGETLHLFDVREPWEYEEANLGAQLIPLGSLLANLEAFAGLENEEIIVHCKAGTRSAVAKALLQQNGFTNVRNLTGGMEAWKKLS